MKRYFGDSLDVVSALAWSFPSDVAIFDLNRKLNALMEHLDLEFDKEPAKEEKLIVRKIKK